MEPYQVIIKPRLIRRMRRFPEHVQRRIADRLDQISRDPYSRILEPLQGRPGFRIRVGGYRVIVERDEERRLFVVRDVDNRDRIYDR